ncbi:hypothetical protein [Streptomyces sviceus]|uniref:hypothetical protein n=1 Tax=Streptomyces sviceus TaxID=285530 RepID=UPI003327A71F
MALSGRPEGVVGGAGRGHAEEVPGDGRLPVSDEGPVARGGVGQLLEFVAAQPGIKFNAVEPGTTATDSTAAFGVGRPSEESAGRRGPFSGAL